MKVLATLMLMVSLLAMGVTAASADITQPPCSAQIRADDMCYAAGLPGSKSDMVKKPGVCLVCLVPQDSAGDPVQPGQRVSASLGDAVMAGSRWTAPWRPPRA